MTLDYPGVVELPPRPTWDEYGLSLAEVVATRSDCVRRQVGAVVLASDHRVVGTGYNGSPAGLPGCGDCPRRTSGVAPLTEYSNCVAIHAEANVLLYTRREDLQGGTLYITRAPCDWCVKLIKASGLARVVFIEGNRLVLADVRDL